MARGRGSARRILLSQREKRDRVKAMSLTRWTFFVILGTVGYLWADNAVEPLPAKPAPPGYVLGANDQISVDVVELPEFNSKSYRVDPDGTVSLPLLGRVQAAGLTLSQFETQVQKQLERQVRHPHLVTNLVETRSQGVSVIGAVNTPGVQQLQGAHTLFDVLAGAGGLKPEAGDVITVTRQGGQPPLDLPGAVRDPVSGRTTAAVKIKDLVDKRDPHVNFTVAPHDEISVPKAQVVYVIGNVQKAGGFTISEGREVSALEALSLAQGLAPNASASHARILRRNANGGIDRQEIAVDLKKILDGKTKDVALLPDDILFIPDNVPRKVTTRVLETAVQTISGVVIWRGI
jgi:polysaccharide export outer membrane protein